MDLDGFKFVNDKYGHPVGDRVLRTLFNYLAQGLRTSDFLARYGGDELTLVLHKSDLPATKLVTDKITEKLQEFIFALPDGTKLNIGMSGGIALYPIHGQTSSQLLRAADEALYRSKKHERGSFTIANPPTGQL
jgi:diguanylate cyclase (GGDEF)-like protein